MLLNWGMLFKTILLNTDEKRIIRPKLNPAWVTTHARWNLKEEYLKGLKKKKKKEMSEMVQLLWFHIKTQRSHDDKVCDECLRNRTVQMSQFSVDKSSHAP